MMTFHACLTHNREHTPTTCHVSATIRTHYASLTCVCGAGCILQFKEPQAAWLWELRSSTVTIDDVRGLIRRGSLIAFSMPFSKEFCEAVPASVSSKHWGYDVRDFMRNETQHLDFLTRNPD